LIDSKNDEFERISERAKKSLPMELAEEGKIGIFTENSSESVKQFSESSSVDISEDRSHSSFKQSSDKRSNADRQTINSV